MSVALKRWTRREYEAMVTQGILAPESHVQLLDGEIILKAAITGHDVFTTAT